jgi:hypothetical protein
MEEYAVANYRQGLDRAQERDYCSCNSEDVEKYTGNFDKLCPR